MSKEKVEEVEVPVVEAPAAPVEEMVSVPASDLKKMMEDIRDLKGAVSGQKLEASQAANAPKSLPSAYLKVFMGKIVTGWKAEKAELLYHPSNSNMPTGEILKGKYFFIDGTDSGIVDQVLFTRCEDRVNVSIAQDLGSSVMVRFDSLVSNDPEVRDNFVMPSEPVEVRKDFLNP